MKRFLFLIAFLPVVAFAQTGLGTALPSVPPASSVASNNFSQEVSQVTQAKMKKLGFAANDPRYKATLDSMSSKAAQRSATLRTTNPGLMPATASASWVSSFLGSVSRFFGGVAGYFALSFIDPAGPFGWTYCPGNQTAQANCLLQRYGKSVPVGDPVTQTFSGTMPPDIGVFCIYPSGNLPFVVGVRDCPGVASPSNISQVSSPGMVCTASLSSALGALRAACPNIGRTFDPPQVSRPYVTRWRSFDYTWGNGQVQFIPTGWQYGTTGGYNNFYWTTVQYPAIVAFRGTPPTFDDVANNCPAGSYRISGNCVTPSPNFYADDGTLVQLPDSNGSPGSLPDQITEIEALPLPVSLPDPKPYGNVMPSATLSPEIAPFFINDLWRDLSDDPDYVGVPFPESDPVTVPDVQAYRDLYPDYVPRIGDFFKPFGNPGDDPGVGTYPNPYQLPAGEPSPTQSPDPVSSPNPNPGTVTNPVPDLGPDPGIGSPELEPIPEPVEILRPLFELFPDLKSYAVPQHTGVCPQPRIQIGFMGVDTIMTAHCDILDDNKPAIYAFMLLVWGVLAMLIILRA